MTYVGRHVIHHSVPVAAFKKKFAVVAILLLIFDVAISVILITSAPKDDKCTSLERPWFSANIVVLFCLIPNIFYQYIQNQRKDVVVAQYVINSINMEEVLVFATDDDAEEDPDKEVEADKEHEFGNDA